MQEFMIQGDENLTSLFPDPCTHKQGTLTGGASHKQQTPLLDAQPGTAKCPHLTTASKQEAPATKDSAPFERSTRKITTARFKPGRGTPTALNKKGGATTKFSKAVISAATRRCLTQETHPKNLNSQGEGKEG